MKEDESPFVDYSKGLPDDLDDETLALLKLARMHRAAKKTFASDEDINRRSMEKRIPPYQARKELLEESKTNREQLLRETEKLLKPQLSKETKQKLGMKDAGRPPGSKNKTPPISKNKLYAELERLAKSKNELGGELRQKEAAKALGLGGDKQLRLKLRELGDERRWKDILHDLLT